MAIVVCSIQPIWIHVGFVLDVQSDQPFDQIIFVSQFQTVLVSLELQCSCHDDGHETRERADRLIQSHEHQKGNHIVVLRVSEWLQDVISVDAQRECVEHHENVGKSKCKLDHNMPQLPVSKLMS